MRPRNAALVLKRVPCGEWLRITAVRQCERVRIEITLEIPDRAFPNEAA
jgi:hypothetical protein